MSDNKYNGWTNYETWRVNLEIIDGYDPTEDFDKKPDVDTLVGYLEQMVDDVLTNYGETTEGLALDYARSFVSDVDFREIAEALIEDYEWPEEDEEEDNEH